MPKSDIVGLDKTLRNLKNLSGKVERKIARSAVASAGTILLNQARADAPKDKGFLQNALIKKARNRANNHYYSTLVTVDQNAFRSRRTVKKYSPDWVERYFSIINNIMVQGTSKYKPTSGNFQTSQTQAQEAINKMNLQLGKKIEAEARK